MSIRDKAKGARPGVQDVPVPEWDCTIRIKAMSANEASDFVERRAEELKKAPEGASDFRGFWSSLLVATCWDPETDELAFGQEGDVEMLNKLPGQAAVISRLGQIASDLCGLSQKARDAAGKDSSGTPEEEPATP